jgi:hypothetical protein
MAVNKCLLITGKHKSAAMIQKLFIFATFGMHSEHKNVFSAMKNASNGIAMPFKKGQSGNPARQFSSTNQPANKGPKRQLPDLKDLVAKVLGNEINDVTVAEAILLMLAKKSLSGDLKAADMILDRSYGKPTQVVENTGEQPLTIKIVRTDGDNTQP